ncbi:MAG TPA: antibiotic biosynthesis monooxygenase [Acidimicrobiales bacterium]|nr:antibiotic biosynthesis monooxygenase [Acidimicrobiales bacterium]
MVTVAVRHRVADFNAWKVVYDEHGAVRKEHGCTGDSVLRDETDPNEVMVLTYWPDLAAAHAFRDDPSLPAAMGRGGIVGAPRIEVYEEAGA